MKSSKSKIPGIYEISDCEMREQNGGSFKEDVATNTAVFFRFIYNWLKENLS